MKKITKKNIGEILQRIYDSEIHLRIGWLWDGGVDYSIGSTSNDIWGEQNRIEIYHTLEIDIVKAIKEMVDQILREYPNSVFSKWFKAK